MSSSLISPCVKWGMVKRAEACAVNWAVCSGKCDKCRYLDECETNRSFKFPDDAACTIKKKEILKKWSKEDDYG